jgi:Ca2+-binding RTX toxin-like protein
MTACALALAAVPAAATTTAQAATITRAQSDGATYLVFQATPGVHDRLEVFHGPQGVTFSTFMSESSHQSDVCTSPAGNRPHEVLCSLEGVDALYVDTGDGDDEVAATHANGTLGLPIVIAGGEGDDRLRGGAGDDLVGGEAGNDKIDDSAGADAMDGGPGDDRFGSAFASTGDVVKGGPGADVAAFSREQPFTVSLDGQATTASRARATTTRRSSTSRSTAAARRSSATTARTA